MISNQFLIFTVNGAEIGINLSNIVEVDFVSASLTTVSNRVINVDQTGPEIKQMMIEVQALGMSLTELGFPPV